MDQQQIDLIYQQYPWATEITLEKVSSSMTINNSTMAMIAAVLGKKDAASIRELSSDAEDAEDTVTKSGKATVKSIKIAGGAMNTIMKGSDPVNATAELAHEAAKIMANAGIGLSNMGAGMGKWASGLKMVARHAGTPLVVATGMGIIFAKLLTEQEKQARQLIDFGAVVSDIDHWTKLRFATRDLGMGLKDFNDLMAESKPFLVQAEENLFEGALRLAEFAKEIDQDKTFKDYGMGIQDQTRFITQEIQTLYQLGEITEMNAAGRKRVIDSYRSANNLALFTGDVFGMQREEALRLRDEARNNVDLRVGLLQNKAFIEKTYGEQASKNISDATGIVRVLNEQLFGADFAGAMEGVISGFVGDISFDQTAANNISKTLIETLQGAPGASEALINLVEKIGTGQFKNEAETVDAYKKFFKLIKDVPFKVTAGDPNLEALNALLASAKTAAGAEEFLMSDTDTLTSGLYADRADMSDTSIEVMNNMAIAFQEMQELLTPGFGSMATGFRTLSGSLMKFGRGVSKLFHGEEQGDNRFETFWEEHRASIHDKRLSQINEGNVVSNVQIVEMQIKQMRESTNELEAILESEYAPDYTDPETNEVIKGEKITEEQRQTLENLLMNQTDELLELISYQEKLQAKKVELLGKEEATVE